MTRPIFLTYHQHLARTTHRSVFIPQQESRRDLPNERTEMEPGGASNLLHPRQRANYLYLHRSVDVTKLANQSTSKCTATRTPNPNSQRIESNIL